MFLEELEPELLTFHSANQNLIPSILYSIAPLHGQYCMGTEPVSEPWVSQHVSYPKDHTHMRFQAYVR